MTDLIETRLRELFADDADHAPLASDLAGSARRVARGQRRQRGAAAAAALAVAAVLGWVGFVQTQTSSTPHFDPAVGPSPQQSASPTPSGSTNEMSALYYRNVEVPVPVAMLDPNAMQCGIPVSDAAYVRTGAHRACLIEPAHPELLTTVVLTPTGRLPAGWAPGTRVLPDGRTQVSSGVPGGDLTIIVTSPDPKRADMLFNGLRIVDKANGCAVREDVTLTADNPPLPAPSAVSGGSACVYDTAGWLTASGWLDASTGARFVEALRLAEEPVPCPGSTGRVHPIDHWSIHLRVPNEELVFRIPGESCQTGPLKQYVAEAAPPHTGG